MQPERASACRRARIATGGIARQGRSGGGTKALQNRRKNPIYVVEFP